MMMATARTIGALVAGALLSGAANPQALNFLACPVAQDTGPTSDFCFFTDHQGERYALLNPNDFGNPQLGHLVLVEGVRSGDDRHCGGIVLSGRVSVMPELSPECDRIEPWRTGVQAPFQPSAERARMVRDELAAIAVDPQRSLIAYPLAAPGQPAVALGQVDVVYYPFQSDRSTGPDAERMLHLARLAGEHPEAAVMIRSYRGATLLDDGTVLVERAGIATQRAEKVSGILSALGARSDRISRQVVEDVPTATGEEDWKSRRIEIVVTIEK